MSNPHRSHLPPEILDYIIDLLDDELETLEECCLVSKSWVPRTRKHLFAEVEFHSATDLELWKKTFPDQSSSPAYYTHTLLVSCLEDVTVADAEQGGWIRSFSRVVELHVYDRTMGLNPLRVSLVPFHGFSPVLKHLLVASSTLSNSEIFALISSLPLLEDLTLLTKRNNIDDDAPNFNVPPTVFQSTSPALAGTLDVIPQLPMGPTARWLLSLPNGLRFQTIKFSWIHQEDPQWVTALVVGCSHTLKSLTVMYRLTSNSSQTSIDLTKATKLGNVTFHSASTSVEWITLALQTITPNHRDLRQICIYLPYDWILSRPTRQSVGEVLYGQWLALDRILVQLRESCSIRLEFKCCSASWMKVREVGEFVDRLFPETTKKGIIVLVNGVAVADE